MTVYSPCTLPANLEGASTPSNCSDCKRPFLLLMHGGSLRVGCKSALEDKCIEFAKRGYVVAAIDYRLGWVQGDELVACESNYCVTSQNQCGPVNEDSCLTKYKDSFYFATYRAVQDGNASLRFVKHYASQLGVDPNFMYIGGYSAGSGVALSMAFLNQQETDEIMPGASTILGPLYSYGNTLTDTYKIAGIFNNWSAVIDTNYINGPEDAIPVISFHGFDDRVAPYAKSPPALNCTNGAYGTFYGSSLIYQRLKNLYRNLPGEIYGAYGGHGIFEGKPMQDAKVMYTIEKVTCFFRRSRAGDTAHMNLQIFKNENLITRAELDNLSPVVFNYTPCVQTTYYHDADGDGYGNAADTLMACIAPENYTIRPYRLR